MPSNTDRLRTALADRYRIERELGSGGMATVYLAEDLKHHRKVAVKVLRSDIAASLGADRFLREIEIAAQLQHPHILMLIDSGEADGFLYYVMPFVDGESLRDRLARETELPVAEAVRILRDVVDALSHAHEHGVVHRDIKPDNILLSGNHAVVTDFGVAKAVSEATGRQDITTAGVALGTPTYMAPEQAVADPNIDQRVDIYAVGVMAYELLTGRPPFIEPTAQAVLAAHVADAPEHVSTRRPAVTPALAEIVMQCLEKKPADRLQSTGVLLGRLDGLATPSGGMEPTPARSAVSVASSASRKMVVAVGAIAVFAIAATFWFAAGRGGDTAGAGDDGPQRLAVLLFQNLSRDEEDQYFTDGITQDISVQLSKVGAFRVTAHGSASRFQSGETDYGEAAGALNADYLVDGSVRRSGDRIRISVSLVDPATGDQLWAEDYNRDLSATGIFAIQQDVARQVATALNATLSPGEEGEVAALPTSNLEAYNAYLRGRFFWNRRTEESLIQAIALFEQAIAIDSGYALAYSGLADSYSLLAWYGSMQPDEAAARARAAVETALALDSTSAVAFTSLGFILAVYEWDWTAAEAAYRRAIQLNPGYATAHQWYGGLLFAVGRFEEGLAEVRRALEFDPIAAIINSNLGQFLVIAGKPEESIMQLTQVAELDSTFQASNIGWAYFALGRYAEAAEAFESGNDLPSAAHAHARLGHTDRARDMVAEFRRWVAERRAEDRWVSFVMLARAAAALDDTVLTFDLLERAVEAQDPRLAYINLQLPWLDGMRTHPRYTEIMRRTGRAPDGTPLVSDNN